MSAEIALVQLERNQNASPEKAVRAEKNNGS